jgi:prevent-host-death family protein
MKTMDASRVRGDFAAVLESVHDDGRPVVIVRYGRPIAALVPLARLSPRELQTLDHRHPQPPPSTRGTRATGRAR